MTISKAIIRNLICLLICLSSIAISPLTYAAAETTKYIQYDYELDPYYTNVSAYINFNNKDIPLIEDDSEENIYKRLISNTALPQYMLIEFSINPLPILGTIIKKEHQNTYEQFDIGQLNLLQAVTEGFEEPYALSVFFGSVVQFSKSNESIKSKNKGYMGYLFSIGDQHIVNNQLIDDNWYEIEWKIKGDLDFEKKELSWSLRTGAKIHQHENIQDVIYFSVRRSHFNNIHNNFSWINNSDIEYTLELNNETGEIVQQEFIVTKKWALNSKNKQALNIGAGIIQQKNKYNGALIFNDEEYRLILRSNFQF